MIERVTYVTLKTNVKTNKMGSTKWTNHKECSLAVTFFLLKILFQYKDQLKGVGLKYQLPKCP